MVERRAAQKRRVQVHLSGGELLASPKTTSLQKTSANVCSRTRTLRISGLRRPMINDYHHDRRHLCGFAGLLGAEDPQTMG